MNGGHPLSEQKSSLIENVKWVKNVHTGTRLGFKNTLIAVTHQPVAFVLLDATVQKESHD